MAGFKEKLWRIVDENRDELFQICADLIKIPSVEPGQMESILDFECAFLADAKIDYEVVRAPNGMPSIVASAGKKGGKDGKVGAFNGHTDVVPVGELSRWDFSPYCGTITDKHILGRGTSDMKCGVGMMLFIAKKTQELALPVKGEIRLHIVHDEEDGGLYGTKYLTENGYADDIDFCIIPEPTSYNNVEVGQKGSILAEITAYGQPFNGSVINYVGENAVHKMVRVLNSLTELRKMKAEFPPEEQQLLRDSKDVIRNCFGMESVEKAIDCVNINLRSVDGGTSRTMTPEICRAQFSLNCPAYLPIADVQKEIERILAKECPKGGVEIQYLRAHDGATTSINEPLVKSTLKHSNELFGKKVVAAHQWATSDTKYYRNKGIPAIQYGPAIIEGIHAYNEKADKEEIATMTKVFFAVLDDLIGFGA